MAGTVTAMEPLLSCKSSAKLQQLIEGQRQPLPLISHTALVNVCRVTPAGLPRSPQVAQQLHFAQRAPRIHQVLKRIGDLLDRHLLACATRRARKGSGDPGELAAGGACELGTGAEL